MFDLAINICFVPIMLLVITLIFLHVSGYFMYAEYKNELVLVSAVIVDLCVVFWLLTDPASPVQLINLTLSSGVI